MEYSHSSRINISEHREPITNSMFSQNNGTVSVSAQCDTAIKTQLRTCTTSDISCFLEKFSYYQSKKKKTMINFPEKSNTLFPCHSLPVGIAGLKYQIYKSEIK